MAWQWSRRRTIGSATATAMAVVAAAVAAAAAVVEDAPEGAEAARRLKTSRCP